MQSKRIPKWRQRVPHGWVTLQDHLGTKASLPGNGPDTGAAEKKVMTAGRGLETDGLGAGSCLSGRQTTVRKVHTDFPFSRSGTCCLVDSRLQFDFVLSS